jgi:dihydrofolate reductase
MGRKTFESIGRILPGRTSIVITRNPDYQAHGCPAEDCLIAGSIEGALALAEARGETEVFVIGGTDIYAQCLALADRLYLTTVHARVQVDTYFPEFDESDWVERERMDYPADENHPYAFTIRLLERAG